MNEPERNRRQHGESIAPTNGMPRDLYHVLKGCEKSLGCYLNVAPLVEGGTELEDFTFAPWVRLYGVTGSRPMSIEFVVVSPAQISIVVRSAAPPQCGKVLWRYVRGAVSLCRDEFGNSIVERLAIALELTLMHVMHVGSEGAVMSETSFSVLTPMWDAIEVSTTSNERWGRKYLTIIRTSRP